MLPAVSEEEISAPDTTIITPENNTENSVPAVSEEETPIPEQTMSYPYTFTGYDYILQDAGDGWNQGSMRFAIENQSDHVLYLDTLNFQNGGIVLETLEGPTYPVRISQKDSMIQDSRSVYPQGLEQQLCSVRLEMFNLSRFSLGNQH